MRTNLSFLVLGLLAVTACSSSKSGGNSADSGTDASATTAHGGSSGGHGGGSGGHGGGANGNSDAGNMPLTDGGPLADGSTLSDGSIASDGSAPGDGSAFFDGGDASGGSGLQNGSGYSIVYSASPFIGIDQRNDVSATFDLQGNLLSYNAAPNEHIGRGAATLRSADTDGVVAWGTWIGGPTTGVYATTTNGFTFAPPSGGFHYAIGKTVINKPTGTVSYALSGGSQPTVDTGNPGSLDSAAIVIDYDTSKVGVEIHVTTDDGPITYETTGGIADLSAAEGTVALVGFFVNRPEGGLYGKIYNEGDGLGIAYSIYGGSASDGGTPPVVRGAAGFHRQ